MKEHHPSCPRVQFWDAGEWECPCLCWMYEEDEDENTPESASMGSRNDSEEK